VNYDPHQLQAKQICSHHIAAYKHSIDSYSQGHKECGHVIRTISVAKMYPPQAGTLSSSEKENKLSQVS
jgi:hypothetical protein